MCSSLLVVAVVVVSMMMMSFLILLFNCKANTSIFALKTRGFGVITPT
jgi:hypothetical protein